MASFASAAFSIAAFSVNAFDFDAVPTTTPSGGYYEPPGRARRTPEDVRRDRVKFGVLQDRIIEDVAMRQAETLRLNEQQRLEELRGELRLQGLEMESRHISALNVRRQELIDAEIGQLLRARLRARIEEEELFFLVMVAAVS